jgi:hypothetical protein
MFCSLSLTSLMSLYPAFLAQRLERSSSRHLSASSSSAPSLLQHRIVSTSGSSTQLSLPLLHSTTGSSSLHTMTFDPTTPPTPQELEKAKQITVKDEEGKDVLLGDLLDGGEQPVIAIWIRHFVSASREGCLLEQEKSDAGEFKAGELRG